MDMRGNSQMDMRGCVWVEDKFSKPWQVADQFIEWHFFTIHILIILLMTQTQEITTHRVSKIHEWIQGDVYD